MIYDKCKQEQDTILTKWLADFFKHHSLDAVGVSRTVDDKFLNPVGHTVKTALKYLYPAILGDDVEQEEIKKQVQELMRIQAVQQLSPAQAIVPLQALKEHLYTLLKKEIEKNFKEYKEICDRIDTLMLIAFDIYTQDKETLYRIRVNELKSAQSQILRFAQSKGYPVEN